jgi:hypothetical protein
VVPIVVPALYSIETNDDTDSEPSDRPQKLAEKPERQNQYEERAEAVDLHVYSPKAIRLLFGLT